MFYGRGHKGLGAETASGSPPPRPRPTALVLKAALGKVNPGDFTIAW